MCVKIVCVCVCVKIHSQRDKLEVVFRIDEDRYVARFATGLLRTNSLFVSLYTTTYGYL